MTIHDGWPDWVVAGAEVTVGLGFCVGILLMNLPQHYLCWKHRSAEGLSLAYILICTISNATLALATVMGDYDEIVALAATTGSSTAFDAANATQDNSMAFQNDGGASRRSLLFWQTLLPEEEPIPGMLRLLKILNACMPTIQNFMSLWVGVPSLLVYYFWFSRPQPCQSQSFLSREENMVPTTKNMSPQSASKPPQTKHVRSASDEPLLLPKYRPSYSDLSTDTADMSFTSSSEDDFDLLLRTKNSTVRYYY